MAPFKGIIGKLLSVTFPSNLDIYIYIFLFISNLSQLEFMFWELWIIPMKLFEQTGGYQLMLYHFSFLLYFCSTNMSSCLFAHHLQPCSISFPSLYIIILYCFLLNIIHHHPCFKKLFNLMLTSDILLLNICFLAFYYYASHSIIFFFFYFI